MTAHCHYCCQTLSNTDKEEEDKEEEKEETPHKDIALASWVTGAAPKVVQAAAAATAAAALASALDACSGVGAGGSKQMTSNSEKSMPQ